jgi:hypothetical protein
MKVQKNKLIAVVISLGLIPSHLLLNLQLFVSYISSVYTENVY